MARSTNLNVQITGDTRGLQKAGKDAGGVLDKLGKQTSVTARVTQRGFSGIGIAARGAAAATVGLTAGVGFLVSQYEESNKVGKQTEAVLKSTGGAARVSAKDVGDLATAISKKTGVDDEAIQSGENLLLTFTNLRNETGKGNDIFTQTTRLMTDMSVALGQDTKSSAIQLGKALNDPIKGVTALQRVGVSFTSSQKDQIKTLVESGKTLDAQKLILGELTKEFGGSAAAQATPFDKLKVSAGNLAETVGGALAPALETGADKLNSFLEDAAAGEGPVGSFLSSVGKIPGALADEFNKIKDDPRGPGAAIGSMIVDGIDSVDWRSLGEKVSNGFNAALKIGGKVGSAIVDAFQQVPWDKVGDAIGAGVEGSLNFADTLPQKISAGISAAASQINGRQVLGKLVDILGEAIDALFSPSFWIDHWKGIFATVTLVIPFAKILKIPGASTLFKFISKPVFDAIGFLGKGMLSLFGKAATEGTQAFLIELHKVLPRTQELLLNVITGGGRTLSRLPGRLAGIAGDAANAVAQKLGSATGTIVGKITGWIISGIKGLAKLTGRVATEGTVVGRSILSGIVGGLGSLGHALLDKIKDAVGWVKGQVGNLASGIGKKLNPFGDGVGRPALPSVANFGGGLMGARPSLAPFAAAGARFGLHVSSGRRPGSITSSGNVSYHSSGEAIDVAGSPAGMLGFFRQMKSKYGSRLAELIYTPGGQGVKDGHPYTYGGAVAADHFDHVHVAYDTGPPGVGDGLGKFDATSYGPPWGGIQGTGVTATGVNLKGNPHTYGVAVDPKVIPLGSKLKITPNPFNYGGTFTAFDTGGAIKGKRIDFYDWRGRGAQLGWGHKSVTVSTASSSTGGGKGGDTPVKGGGTVTVTPKTKVSIPPSYTVEVPSADEMLGSGLDDAARAKAFAQKRAGKTPPPPMKGRLQSDYVEPPAAAAGPSAGDLLARDLAYAQLTPDTADDRAVYERMLAEARGRLGGAINAGDVAGETQAVQDIKSLTDSLDSLADSTKDNTDAIKAHTDALKQVGDELKRQSDFATSVTNTSNFQLTKTLADILSGHIVGYGVAGRAFTPGTGVEVAY